MIALAALVLACAACLRVNVEGTPDPRALERLPDEMARVVREAMPPVRFATYNTSLYSDEDGGLVRRLQGDDADARKIAAVLQRVRPDVVLLNEFDFDAEGRAADLFQRQYLGIGQLGGAPLHYPFRYIAEVNTGVTSGLDIDGDGQVGQSGRARGNDAWGYGLHPGQYGMLVLSMYPLDIDHARTFRLLKWSAMPDARRPVDPVTGKPVHTDATWRQLRLSSKSHWDIPVLTPQGEIHFLASHPTPPTFDGPEDRNGRRNADEIRLWAEYVSGKPLPWLCDDNRHCGGLPDDARFVIAGDLNADPVDGDSVHGAINRLLDSPRVLATRAPTSPGAAEQARRYGIARKGDIATHTGNFGPKAGTLRIDYVLPSRGLRVLDTGVAWPAASAPDADFSNASDHHAVWIDVVAD
ncbi:MAG: endonuclease/exonuclease/phosphatase family protein [Xanthomonadaceae bacterium]|nr:endonuclease/exonuclease/phosphatase family protein [Xanthomonadaceae bacterium]